MYNAETVPIEPIKPIPKLQNAVTVPKQTINQFPRSLGDWETGPQDSWGIGFICFFGTVSAFGIISIGFIRSIGIVAAFDTNRIGVIGCRTNSTSNLTEIDQALQGGYMSIFHTRYVLKA